MIALINKLYYALILFSISINCISSQIFYNAKLSACAQTDPNLCVPVETFEVLETGQSDCNPALIIKIFMKTNATSSNIDLIPIIANLYENGTIGDVYKSAKIPDCRRTIR
jgi:hypothetical protein